VKNKIHGFKKHYIHGPSYNISGGFPRMEIYMEENRIISDKLELLKKIMYRELNQLKDRISERSCSGGGNVIFDYDIFDFPDKAPCLAEYKPTKHQKAFSRRLSSVRVCRRYSTLFRK
jgi:hypothetical protein